MVAKVPTKEVAAVQAQAMVYNVAVQTIFPYGSDIWVVTGAMLTVLEGFHHWLARQIARNTSRRAVGNGWE